MKCLSKNIIFVLIVFVVFAFTCFGCNQNSDEYYYVFGTQVEIKISGKNVKNVQSDLYNLYSCQDADFDAENTSSSVYYLNKAKANDVVEVSSDVYYLLMLSKELYDKTSGAFNIATYNLSELWEFTSTTYSIVNKIYTPPTNEEILDTLVNCNLDDIVLLGDNKVKKLNDNVRIGLGAIAKGYAGDKSFDYIDGQRGILNVGGTIFTVGNDTYNIGISNPRDTSVSYFGKITIGGNAVVCTSGDYERYYEREGIRYCHILGKDGYPVNNGIMSVTILSTDRTKVSGAMCDILSTSVFALGREDGICLLKEYGVGAVIIYNDKTYETIDVDTFSLKDTSYTIKNV